MEKQAKVGIDMDEASQKLNYLQHLLHQAREKSRELYHIKETKSEFDLRFLIDCQIASIALQFTSKAEITDAIHSFQFVVSTSFIRSHFLIWELILDGEILEAAVLMRKQIEYVSRLRQADIHIESGRGKTKEDFASLKDLRENVASPQNCKVVKLDRIYGNLSKVVHFYSTISPEDAGNLLGAHSYDDGRNAIGMLPAYTEKSWVAYATNCMIAIEYIFWAIEKLPTIYSNYDNTVDKYLSYQIKALAHAVGILELSDNASDEIKSYIQNLRKQIELEQEHLNQS